VNGRSKSCTGGTLDTLEARIAVVEAQIKAAEKLSVANFASAEKAVAAALAAVDKAITKSEMSDDKRFAGVNEMRGMLNDLTRTLMPRNEYDARHETLIQSQAAESKRMTVMEAAIASISSNMTGRKEGIGMVGALILGGVTMVSAMAAIGTMFLTALRH